MEYINEGMIFPRNRDIDGKVILVLKSKLHVRGLRDTDQLIRNFIYWVERLNRYVLNIACNRLKIEQAHCMFIL